ncbi:hypothetical protein J6590_082501 [Homalodisca vitripennis]|nr:hypothetical protein J6590_082501 [Homalodisca vitripennis]
MEINLTSRPPPITGNADCLHRQDRLMTNIIVVVGSTLFRLNVLPFMECRESHAVRGHCLLVRPAHQLIEMSTVIRSEPVPGERGASLRVRVQGADVELRSSIYSSNPIAWDLE